MIFKKIQYEKKRKQQVQRTSKLFKRVIISCRQVFIEPNGSQIIQSLNIKLLTMIKFLITFFRTYQLPEFYTFKLRYYSMYLSTVEKKMQSETKNLNETPTINLMTDFIFTQTIIM